jgi:hypothetical protein
MLLVQFIPGPLAGEGLQLHPGDGAQGGQQFRCVGEAQHISRPRHVPALSGGCDVDSLTGRAPPRLQLGGDVLPNAAF